MALRDEFGRWLFEQDPRENWPGASPSEAGWEQWVERNQEQWVHTAGEILTHSPITPMYELVNWLVSLDDDDPASQGRKDRQAVTLTQIINKAKLALGAMGGPYPAYEDDGETD